MHYFISLLQFVSILFAAVSIAASPAGAQSPVDLRLVVIDTGYFAEIQSKPDRLAAISAMSKQLRALEAGTVANKTVLLYEVGSSIEKFRDVAENKPLSDQPEFAAFIKRMKNGSGYDTAGLELVDLRKAAFDMFGHHKIIQKRGWFGSNKSVMPKSVAVHIFAQDWVTEESDVNGRVVEQDIPTSCVHEGRKNNTILPSYIDIEFGFMPPLGGKAPTSAGMSALTAVVTGSAARRQNVSTRGVWMPKCPYNDAIPVEPWGTTGASGAGAQCNQINATRLNVSACPDGTPQFKGVAPNLDDTPVHLVANPNVPALSLVSLSSSNMAAGVSALAHVGPMALGLGAAPQKHGLSPSRYAARLDLAAANRCQPNPGFSLTLGDGSLPDGLLNVSVSRHYCQGLSLPISALDLR